MRKVFLFFALFLTACQTTGSSTIGSGPITLSPQMQSYLDQYMGINGIMFAVTVDGRSWASYRYCPDIICRDSPGERQLTIDHCEKGSNGIPCKIYAIRKEIVWDFGGAGQQSENNYSQQWAEADKKPKALSVEWQGQGDALEGWIDPYGDFVKIQSSTGSFCPGKSTVIYGGDEGTWKIDCYNGTTAEGTFSGYGSAAGIVGTGTDNNGNVVKFVRVSS